MKPYRVLVTGSRTWTDTELIQDMFRIIHTERYGFSDGVVLIHGKAVGADTMAEEIAQKFGWTIERHPADWETHGKRAGYLRNWEMVNSGADLCLAFIHNHSRGASMCADLAEKAGIPTKRFQRD